MRRDGARFEALEALLAGVVGDFFVDGEAEFAQVGFDACGIVMSRRREDER